MVPLTEPGFAPEVPVHGYRGESAASARPAIRPGGLTLAISREVGARGGTIARKVGELLAWQVFDHESIDYLLQQETARAQLEAELQPQAQEWLQQQRREYAHHRWLVAETGALADLLLVIAARGEAVIVGRAAGFLLPACSTLHVRIVAPLADRVAWMAQLLRLPHSEAEREVLARESRRNRFLEKVAGVQASDVHNYDAVLNSSRLGVEATAQILGWMVRTREATKAGEPSETGDSGLWERS
ncbi:MAG: cytidylate kinase-like family protein [Gemmataceae bacterium]|nr:cytidylate kinase-like family protein [Gemmataceae bacterium]MCS7270834.1 cytidylate kinase-like family protein [Gemmataceae bacterium]MDW8242940.1 cytidylate kinase-like family protein [Thermogemmata sp.]